MSFGNAETIIVYPSVILIGHEETTTVVPDALFFLFLQLVLFEFWCMPIDSFLIIWLKDKTYAYDTKQPSLDEDPLVEPANHAEFLNFRIIWKNSMWVHFLLH